MRLTIVIIRHSKTLAAMRDAAAMTVLAGHYIKILLKNIESRQEHVKFK